MSRDADSRNGETPDKIDFQQKRQAISQLLSQRFGKPRSETDQTEYESQYDQEGSIGTPSSTANSIQVQLRPKVLTRRPAQTYSIATETSATLEAETPASLMSCSKSVKNVPYHVTEPKTGFVKSFRTTFTKWFKKNSKIHPVESDESPTLTKNIVYTSPHTLPSASKNRFYRPTTNKFSNIPTFKLPDAVVDFQRPVIRELSPEESKMLKKRFEVSSELLSTEETYITDMKNVLDLILNPMVEKKMVPFHFKSSLISYLEQIIPINEYFCSQLKANFSPNGIKNAGQVFLSIADFFKVYKIYIGSQPDSLKQLHSLMEKNENLSCHVRNMKNMPQFRGLELESYLLKPIQRLCKYPLFLKELMSCTEDGAERGLLSKALNKFESIVGAINEGAKHAQILRRTVSALSKIKFRDPIDLLIPTRTLLLESQFKFALDDGKFLNRHIFLFNDILIVTKLALLNKGKFQCLAVHPLSGLFVCEMSNNHFELLLLTYTGQKYRICTKDKDKRDLWFKTLSTESEKAHSKPMSTREQMLLEAINGIHSVAGSDDNDNDIDDPFYSFDSKNYSIEWSDQDDP
ncbi:Guanine-nucleotide dissociation stimulator, CDC24 domain-containing protein [Rozella allomycis CSF55]|uniref:Guanine-nucleotide dissociation stimulator, CDC24 domain-containing protein n=1 Tax=Rozella allomycis (strain CSF55) TaxID=988480 RepID=A0A075ARZ7_ROZAC|nr:Guanine-nucleotide dissociation stimulator, CDC24 domain-containing protein [Rozella allomycis CSF55]|eukprot:EPZ32950.1 Guanine-nucleotide dissociation stimulator, CDC24 domain-containing protein [Rozella allomycis CSF55]